jgi:hypothetical protein
MSKYQIDAEGTYAGVVSDPIYGWLGESKSGTRFVRVPVTITEAGAQNGKTINWYGYLTEKTQDRTIEALEHCFGQNWDWEKINWEGTEVSVVVEQDDYNGKTSFKAKWLNNPNVARSDKDPVQTEAEKAEAKAKAAEIAKELAASMPRRTGSPVAAPTKPAVASKPASRALPPVKTHDEDGEEIPF